MENIKIHKGENLQENNFRGVYLIRNLDNGLLKIGRCNNLARRFKEITKSFNFCGVKPKLEIECFLEYDNEIELELYLHEQFKEVREQNEWFEIEDIHIILEKLDSFKKKEIERKKKIKIGSKKKTEKHENQIKDLSDYYYYFSFMEYKYSRERKLERIERIIWKTKILDISILERKVSDIMKVYYNIHDFTTYFNEGLLSQKINPNESMLEAFEKFNTDCIVEVTDIVNSIEEVVDKYGEIEKIEHEEKIQIGIFDYYTYLYEYKTNGFYESIVYYQKEMGISSTMTLDVEKLVCELNGEDILSYLRKECKRYYKMYVVFKDPDIKSFDFYTTIFK